MQFVGEPLDPPFLRRTSASLLFYAKMFLLGALLMNVNPFEMAGIATPGIFFWAQQHKMQAALLTWFLTNMLESQLMSTGSFEVSLNSIPVWSKLTSGRLPEPPELMQIIDNTMRISAGGEPSWSSGMRNDIGF